MSDSFPEAAQRGQVTELLVSLRDADPEATWDELVPLVYEGLRAVARRQLAREGPGRMDTTVLVHEAFLKLVDQTRVEWKDRAHFYAIAATVMRRILINEAHRRRTSKRGGDQPPRPLEDNDVAVMAPELAEELIALDTALGRLEALDARQSKVVVYRYFAGMTVEEIAEALAISPGTVKRDWRLARAWLQRELEGAAGGLR